MESGTLGQEGVEGVEGGGEGDEVVEEGVLVVMGSDQRVLLLEVLQVVPNGLVTGHLSAQQPGHQLVPHLYHQPIQRVAVALLNESHGYVE